MKPGSPCPSLLPVRCSLVSAGIPVPLRFLRRIFGYYAMSHHTVDGSRQLTISVAMALNGPPRALDILTRVFCGD